MGALAAVFDATMLADVMRTAEGPPALRPTGTLAGGIRDDTARRWPHQVRDFTDGLTLQTRASVFFLYFACLTPAVAFGGLHRLLTGGEVGAVEAIVSTAICGTIYAVVSAQPLAILGSAGPVVTFTGMLYELTTAWPIPHLPA